MSQAGSIGGSGGTGPTVPTSFQTDNGTAVPALNILIVHGKDSTVNNVNGIQANGGVVGTGTSNEVDIVFTNRFHGSATTTDATPTTIASCPMSTNPAVFQFVVNLCAYDVTDNLGETVTYTASYRTTGGVPVILNPPDYVLQDDTPQFPPTSSINFQGTSTNFNVIVTGVAGKTIKWLCHGTYTMVS